MAKRKTAVAEETTVETTTVEEPVATKNTTANYTFLVTTVAGDKVYRAGQKYDLEADEAKKYKYAILTEEYNKTKSLKKK